MSSKALLLGRNGGDLQWCYRDDADGLGECDARKLRDALARHHYEPIVIGAADNPGDIINRLTLTARQCAGGDTLRKSAVSSPPPLLRVRISGTKAISLIG